MFPALPSIFPQREPSFTVLALVKSCWSSLYTLPTSDNSKMFMALTAQFLHFASAPLASSFYNRLSHSFMPTNMLAEMLLLRVKHLHKLCCSQCHCPFLSLLTQVLSFVGLVNSPFGSTFFDSNHFPFKK